MKIEKGAYLVSRVSHIKFFYSAACAAIRFFQSVPSRTRINIRNVVLRESHESVASPETHGRGLIPFHLENPQLRIIRYVDLWQNALPVAPRSKILYLEGCKHDMHGPPQSELEDDTFHTYGITRSLGAWIMDCHHLRSVGMPKESYTLVLDGDPAPEQATAVFDIVQRDVAWQVALDLRHIQRIMPEFSWNGRRCQRGFFYEGLPDAIKGLSTSSSPVRCNFDSGAAHSAEALLDAGRNWDERTWAAHWNSQEPAHFQTEAPLPRWVDLRWQRVLP
jgi:hypothetical protein